MIRQVLRAIAAAGCLWLTGTAHAETPAPPFDSNLHPNADVRVVWMPDSRVVLIAREGRHGLRVGERIEFHRGGYAFATGVVTSVPDSSLAVAISVDPAPTGDEAGILVRRSTPPRLPRIRIGIAAPRRAHPFLPCTVQVLGSAAPFYGGASVLDRFTSSFARDTAVVSDPSWPDTLIFRRYEEAADQEIALERGDIDIAVFPPGDLSARLREGREWGRGESSLDRGVFASVLLGPRVPGDTSFARRAPMLDSMNTWVYRGDLSDMGPDYRPGGVVVDRWSTDADCPAAVRKFLAQASRAREAPRAGSAQALLLCIDTHNGPLVEQGIAVAERMAAVRDVPGVAERGRALARELRALPPEEGGPWWDASVDRLLRSHGVSLHFGVQAVFVYPHSLFHWVVARSDRPVNLVHCRPAEAR